MLCVLSMNGITLTLSTFRTGDGLHGFLWLLAGAIAQFVSVLWMCQGREHSCLATSIIVYVQQAG